MKNMLAMFLSGVVLAAMFEVPVSAAQFNHEMNDYMKSLEKQARLDEPSFKGFDAERGKKIFFEEQPNKNLVKISCTACHTDNLRQNGKNAKTGKLIEPLAPSVNKKRLTNVKDVAKWLRRNFKEVYDREGTAGEKGDVLTFINSN